MLSDSFSALKSISSLKCYHPLLVDLLHFHSRLVCDNRNIVFTFVQGHVSIRGNSVVGLAAKRALEKPVNKRLAVSYSDFKVLTNMYTKKLWQTEWETYPEKKLYKIQPKVDYPMPSHGRYRREESILVKRCRREESVLVKHFKLIFIY